MSTEQTPSRRGRLWRYLTAPGVIWWGLPTAIVGSVWLHGDRYGFGWSDFVSARFALRLAINLAVVGVLGGNLFGGLMAGAGLPLRRGPGEEDRDRPA
jgi:hypothetical protein